MSGFSKKEIALFKKMKSPAKVQDFLNSLPANMEKGGETCRSPLSTIRSGEAHCMEGALLGAYILSLNGFVPYVVHLRAKDPDQDHVFIAFKVGKYWGSISKTNHAVLRYREPVYRDPRELVMSFFHEYFLNKTGEKTLRSYTLPIDLRKFGKEWITREGDVWDIDSKITRTKHYLILSKSQIKNLRKAEKIEIEAGKIVEWK